ncbi:MULTISPECIES: TetR/AcrR family transcriptional regulator [unclassified Mycobacterium]|uniref:TetR/AcrR family transcriptional regulator n=1 Tax=unclassified Mycobacterium TaxID=2642494 RepID=UPI0029C89162|nr:MULTISPECIES: TetR/AcrR family transcriptional regulator [unclassified Mycobacterium]
MCDAAIEVLADDGGRGLTHRKVEQRAGLPDGTTSSYFPTRSALLRGAAERVTELDAAELAAAAHDTSDSDGPASPLSMLAELTMRAATGPALSRARARYELALHAKRDPALQKVLDQATGEFVALSQEAVAHAQADRSLDQALIEEQAYAVTTFLNGVMVRLAFGNDALESADQLHHLLDALVTGIAAARQERQ